MTDAPRPPSPRRRERAGRDKRLAQALRENLRRRKEQSRARDAGGPSAEPPGLPGADDEPAA